MIPAALAGSIHIDPGTFTIDANTYTLVNNGSVQSVSTTPAALQTQSEPPPKPLPFVNGVTSAADQLVPVNAVSQFQVAITSPGDWSPTGSVPAADSKNSTNLAGSSFTDTAPAGHSKGQKSTYTAGSTGAQK